MSRYFNKLPNSVKSPTGFEWWLFKHLPLIFLYGTLLLCLPIVYVYCQQPAPDLNQLKMVYMVLGLIFSYWFFVGAAAIGCVVVIIMKGHAYVADAYELPKENRQLENKSVRDLMP